MKIAKTRKSILALCTLAIALAPSIASAAPVKDAAGVLYIDELTENSRAVVSFPSALKTINSNADACGRITLRNSASNPLLSVTTIQLDGTSIDTSAFSTDTLPRCINGVAEIERASNFKTPDGSFVLVGQTPLSQHAVAFPGISLSRQVNVNACGFISLRSSAQYPVSGTIQVNGTDVDTTAVTTGYPPRCINNVLYKPQ